MKKIAFALAVTAGLAFAATSVQAADLIVDDMDDVMMEDVSSGFDWEGAYVGVFGGFFPFSGIPDVGWEIGYNFLPAENFLLGIEGSGLLYLDGSLDHELFVRGKAGFVTDNVAVYGMLGVGEYDFALALYDIGAGIEFAVTDNVTLNAQAFGRNAWGAPPTVLHVQGGVRYHF